MREIAERLFHFGHSTFGVSQASLLMGCGGVGFPLIASLLLPHCFTKIHPSFLPGLY
jgi:hypothetical protein